MLCYSDLRDNLNEIVVDKIINKKDIQKKTYICLRTSERYFSSIFAVNSDARFDILPAESKFFV